MSKIESHRRTNQIFLGPLERPLLSWLVHRMPAWVNPDMLTATGFTGALIVFSGYLLSNIHPGFLWLASFGFLVNWFGDSLDGTLARYRAIQRPRYGFFVDHTVDTLSEVIIFVGLGLSPFVKFEIALLALSGYLLMSVLVFVRTCVDGEFKISFGRLGPTEVRAIAISANTLVFFSIHYHLASPLATLSLFDLIGIVITFLLYAFFLISVIEQARELARLEEQTRASND